MSAFGIGDILKIVDLLKNGKDAKKIKVDDVKVTGTGHIKVLDVDTVEITGSIPLDNKTVALKATHKIKGDKATITIDGNATTNDDVDLNLITHLFSVEVKSTITFTHGDHNHKVEMYFEVKSL